MTKIHLEDVPCPLCGSDRRTVRYDTPSPWEHWDAAHFAATTDRFGAYGTVVDCADCGLAYTSPRPGAADLLSGYADNKDEDYESERDSRCINAHMSLAVLRRHVPRGRLLEIGCASGFFLNAARTTYDVVGVEPSTWAREYARTTLRLEVPAATLADARLEAGSFDVVVMLDVIEHVADPLGLLRAAGSALKPGGTLYLVTPDIESLSARLLGGRWWGLRPAHIAYFSRSTMGAMLAKAGFDVVEARSYGRIFSWGYWLSRLDNYPKIVGTLAGFVVAAFGIRDKFLYLDTRDSMQIIARRRAAQAA